MGYTHYWQVVKPKGTSMKTLEKQYQKAIDDCGRVARLWNDKLFPKGGEGDHMRLSGYTAHCKPSQGYRGIHLNGKGDLAHEAFCLREHFKQQLKGGWSFCKTNANAYDEVVVACLTILKHHLGDAIEVDSDGDRLDWFEGVKLANMVLRKRLTCPIKEVA